MIETDHQKFFMSLEYYCWSQTIFSKIIKETGTERVSRTIKVLKQFFTEFHSLFVCKVSVGSGWYRLGDMVVQVSQSIFIQCIVCDVTRTACSCLYFLPLF